MFLLRRILLFFIIFNVAALFVVGYWEYEIHFLSASSQLHVIEIKQGTGAKEIASYLHTQGVIIDENAFLFHLWDTRQISHLLPGTYSIQPSTTIAQLAKILTGHGQPQTVRITIPEGSNILEIQSDLQQAGLKISPQNFIHEVFAANAPYVFLPTHSSRKTLEGYLFPDTYEFRRDATAHVVVNSMLANFQRRVVPRVEQQHIRSLGDTIIMASILEKEVQTKNDMQMVAGILWKRLDAKQALQVDATAIYGKKVVEGWPLGLSADSYDTYHHLGLPPTPIGNPGLASIEAALNPTPSDYWFYLSTPDGKTIFSKTLQEHDANRAIYLK